MILAFIQQINNKPTYFVEKIVLGLYRSGLISLDKASELLLKTMRTIVDSELKSKLHTIREDKTNRWKAGMKIDFFINVRQKNMFRFAPVLPVVSTQTFQVTYNGTTRAVYINDMLYYFGEPNEVTENIPNYRRMLQLAQNDGFDTIEDFFEYFSQDFKGKIIHWTDKKY